MKLFPFPFSSIHLYSRYANDDDDDDDDEIKKC